MKLHIENFRSIEQPTCEQPDMDVAPITVLYEHSGTGKSSVLYAPLTMKTSWRFQIRKSEASSIMDSPV